MVHVLEQQIVIPPRAPEPVDALFAYWIQGPTSTAAQPRWFVVRNVLQWVR